MESFTAIDFETATWNPNSICQVGIVRVENGLITDKVDRLVRPPNNTYFHRNVDIHGITPEQTRIAPTFDEVWFDIKNLIEDEIFVAHNVAFDANCLLNTLAYYDIAQPFFETRCTRVIYGRGLAYLCKKYKIQLQHHNAFSDAHACAQLYLMHLRKKELPRTGSLF